MKNEENEKEWRKDAKDDNNDSQVDLDQEAEMMIKSEDALVHDTGIKCKENDKDNNSKKSENNESEKEKEVKESNADSKTKVIETSAFTKLNRQLDLGVTVDMEGVVMKNETESMKKKMEKNGMRNKDQKVKDPSFSTTIKQHENDPETGNDDKTENVIKDEDDLKVIESSMNVKTTNQNENDPGNDGVTKIN